MVRFANQGVTGQFGVEPTDTLKPVSAPKAGDAASKEAATVERVKPKVDPTFQFIIWPGHDLKDGAMVRFNGAPANWPLGLRAVDGGTVFYVEPRGVDWVTLHNGRALDETTRVVFAGLNVNTLHTLKVVPGEFMLDSPRGPGQAVNPDLVGNIAIALDKVVELGGSYALDPDTRKVIYVGLVGPGVRRDAVREPVLLQLAALKDLKYLEIWQDPFIPKKDWPTYVERLKEFKKIVPNCSISMAVPTTLWVRSLNPIVPKLEEEDEEPREITQLALKIRAINLTPYYTIANRDFAAMVVRTINGHPYFGGDPETEDGSVLSKGMVAVATEAMFFDFEIKLVLKEPLMLEDLGGAGRLAGGADEGVKHSGATTPDKDGQKGNNNKF